MTIEEKNIELLIRYFEDGCKSCADRRLGVEVEHFVVNKKNAPVSYEQLLPIMQGLMNDQDTVFEEDGHFLGYYNEDYSITLEPAAQLEVSVMPQRQMERIDSILKKFYAEYGEALAQKDFRLMNLGYHPYRLAEQLPLIPKRRYELMNEYFRHSGSRGYQMMRATASAQVSVDYLNEADFVQKYRLACALVPVFALITDNSPVYEGTRNCLHLARTYVWQEVDRQRCLIPDCCFGQNFGFRAYAEEMYHKPPILVKEQGRAVDTGSRTAAEIYRDKELSEEQIEHLISMFFPDVRLKHYIEIRPADSMPLNLTMAYAQLVQGIFYQKEVVQFLTSYLQVYSRKMIEEAKNSLIRYGYGGSVYGKKAAEVVDIVFQKVVQYLLPAEKERLRPLYELIKQRMTPAEERGIL